jgi:multiple sugar transport system substrate-binding protein
MSAREPIVSKGVTRRNILGGGLSLAALSAFAVACGSGNKSGADANGNVDLDFLVWTYAVDTVKGNIDAWHKANPKVNVRLQDYAWDNYHETMVQRLSSGTATDVLYNNGAWLAEFAAAGWVEPIDSYLDFEKYRSKIVPYAISGMTYQGKPYGLPYYADIASFIWNPTVAKAYGVDKAPTSWDELRTMAETMKAKGLKSPILWEFSQTNPSGLDEYIAMSMSRGGEVFDADMNPTFGSPSSPAFVHAQFMADTITSGLATTSPAELDAVKAMNTGQHVFTCMYNYNLAAMNNKGTSPLAGQFELLSMPGPTKATLGYVRFYSISSMAKKRGADVTKAAGTFIDSMGGAPTGEFTVPKRWAVDRGLGFGVLPLFDDADVQKAFGTWVDVKALRAQQELAQTKREAKWTGIWGQTMLLELSRAFAGQKTVAEAMKSSADRARALKKQYA